MKCSIPFFQPFFETVGGIYQNTYVKIGATSLIIIWSIFKSIKLYQKSQEKKKRSLYPKDTIILHQLPRGLRAPSVSPFALKLETWLRMAGIKYQNDFSRQFSSKKLFPWITYNGVDLADSQFSIEYLSKIHGKYLNEKLDARQVGFARSVLKLCEESIRWCGVIHRFIYSGDPNESGLPLFILKLMKSRTKSYTYGQGYGRHTKEEVYSIGNADLKALDDIIGDSKFLFGDEPCETDASVFGILCQVLYHDRGPFNEYATRSCKNLVRYVETMKEKYWPDWNENIREKKIN